MSPPTPIPADPLDAAIAQCEKDLDDAQMRMSPAINYLEKKLDALRRLLHQQQQAQSRQATAMNQMKQAQAQQMAQMKQALSDQMKSGQSFWGLGGQAIPTELLLSVAYFTDRIPASVTYTVSLEWLRCRISKDSDWLSCSPVKSPQHIKLWEKDFILIQTTLPGSEVIKEVKIGFRLNKVGTTRHVLEPLPQYPGLVVGDVPFLCISDLK